MSSVTVDSLKASGVVTTTPDSTTPDSTLGALSLVGKGVTMAKENLTYGYNYIKNSVYQKERTVNTISMFTMLIILLLFLGMGYYLYDIYVKKMLDTKYVENQEFTDRNTKKQIDFYFFYTNWCPHCKGSRPEWTKFKEKVGDRKINNYSVKFFEVDCDKDSKVVITIPVLRVASCESVSSRDETISG